MPHYGHHRRHWGGSRPVAIPYYYEEPVVVQKQGLLESIPVWGWVAVVGLLLLMKR